MIESVEIDPKVLVRDASKLIMGPQVIRVGGIDEESVPLFAKAMNQAHQTGQPIIPIVIDSFGGDVYAFFSMVDVIRTAKVPIATIVEGKAMSCGAALFTCGAEGYRYMGPNATLMFHDVSMEEQTGKTEEVKVGAKETDRLNRKMWRLMEKNIKKPTGYLSKCIESRGHTDWYMPAKEAVKHNIANHIRIPMMRTVVSVTMGLE